jgi:hypothetical protein
MWVHSVNVRVLAVSAVIVVILGLQTFASFRDPAQWGWPFLAYPMYRGAHYEGERLRHDFTTYAIVDDSSRMVVTPQDLGMTWWWFRANVVDIMLRQDQAALKAIAKQICETSGRSVQALELEDMGVAVGRNGLQDGLSPEVVSTVKVSCQ